MSFIIREATAAHMFYKNTKALPLMVIGCHGFVLSIL